MSSSSSSITNVDSRVSEELGIPVICKCRSPIVMRTSKTEKNPGRLFFCCKNDAGKGGNHVFRWADEAMVEEITGLKSNLATLEKGLKGGEKEIEYLKSKLILCEQSNAALKLECKRVKKMVIAGFVGLIIYMWYCA